VIFKKKQKSQKSQKIKETEVMNFQKKILEDFFLHFDIFDL